MTAGPPDALDGPLELDPETWPPFEVYRLMTGLVVPRPIAWVSTLGADGVPNLAPHSYFAMVAGNPPHVAWSSEGVKDSLTNARATGELVVNVVSVDLAERMNTTAARVAPDVSEFELAGVTPVPSRVVAAPRVAEARAHLECRVVGELAAGSGNLVLCRVVHVHVDPSVWRDGRVDPTLLRPLARLAGSSYASLGEVFSIERPTVERFD